MTNPDFQGVTGISWAPCASDEALFSTVKNAKIALWSKELQYNG